MGKSKKAKNEGDEFWSEGSFSESLSPEGLKEKLKTFHRRHDEDVNYNCKRCNGKISDHNRDWHMGMCDGCFNREFHM